MSVPGATKLANLCADHYHGLLTTETYRRERAQLLRDVLSGSVVESQPPQASTANDDSDTIRNFEPQVLPQFEERPEQIREEQVPDIPVSAEQPAASRSRMPMVLGGIAFLLAAGAGIWFMIGSEKLQESAEPEISADASDTIADRDIAAEFLAASDWTEDGIAGFLFEMDQLFAEQREELKSQTSYQSLIRELRDRIVEERALGRVSTAANYDGMTLLEAFAAELQLDVGLSVAKDLPAQASVSEEDPAGQDSVAVSTPASEIPAAGTTATEIVTVAVEELPDADSAKPTEPTEAQQRLRQARDRKAQEAQEAKEAQEAQEAKEAKEAAEKSLKETPASISTANVEQTSSVAASPSDRPCTADVSTRRKTCWDMLSNGARGPVMVLVPPGSFTMGSAEQAVTSPEREVTIASPFAMASWEISFDQYRLFCEAAERECPSNPWAGDGGSEGEMPVVNISWQDATDYAIWLSAQTEARYRLPSEAEWEYAARGGTSSRYPFGDELSVYDARFNSGDGTESPVSISDKKTERNGFQLWHVVGNVREWTLDGWQDNYSGFGSDAAPHNPASEQKVARGGSWDDGPREVTVTARLGLPRTARDAYTGVRLLRELPAN